MPKIIPFICGFLFTLQMWAQPTTELIKAIQANDLPQVKALVAVGADVNVRDENGATPLMWAATVENLPLCQYLYQQGADVSIKNKDGKTVFDMADQVDHQEVADFFSSLQYIQSAQLLLATKRGDIAKVKEAIKNGAMINEADLKGWTALHHAASNGFIEVTQLLLEQGVHVDVLTEDRKTAYDYAKEKGYKLLAAYLKDPTTDISGTPWKILNDSLQIYYQEGDYNKSLDFAEKAYQRAQQEFSKTNKYYSANLINLAGFYYFIGLYEKAEPLLKESLQITEVALGKDHPDYGISLIDLAGLYCLIGLYEKAEPLLKEALQITEAALGKDHPDYGIRLNNLALLYKSMGRYGEAEPLYKEALQVTEKALGKDHPDYGIRLNNLALLYKSMGRYSEAEPLFKEALQNAGTTLSKDHPDYGAILNGLALLNNLMGNYSEAEILYKEALRIAESNLGKDHSDYGTNLNNLATLYESMGNYSEAEILYNEALQIAESNLGKDHPNYGAMLSGFAGLYASVSCYREAEPLLKEALQIAESNLGKDHPNYGTHLNNLAELYRSMSRYAEAEPLYKEALRNVETTLGKNHPNYGTHLNNLALLYQSMGRYAEAEPLYKKAMQNAETALGKDHPNYGTHLNNLASLYQSMGRYSEAEPLYQQANEVIYHNLNQSFIGLSEKEKKQYMQTFGLVFQSFHSFVLRRIANNPSITTLSYNSTLINKGMLLQSSMNMRQNIQQSGDSVLLQSYDQWIEYKNQLSKLYTLPIKGRYVSTDSLESLANDLEKELNRGASVFREQSEALQVQWEDVKHSLKANEAAIEFISFRYRSDTAWTDSTLYVALVLHAEDEYPQMIELCTEAQLDSLLQGKNMNLARQLYPSRGVKPVNPVQDKGALLYQLIWQPLDSLLEGVQTVYFSPSGLLHQIAFAALPYGEDSLLMDRYQLHQLSSTRIVAQESTPSQDESLSAALFGGIYYDTDTATLEAMADNIRLDRSISSFLPDEEMRSEQLEYLPGSAEEVNNIARQLSNQEVATELFTGHAALEKQFKALGQGSSPTILHIATHGFFFPDVKDTVELKKIFTSFNEQQQVYRLTDDPLRRAGLLMAGANHAWVGETLPEGLDDGILTAYEVSQLNLSNTNLVVLSACETGLGQVQGSEGVYGLQRAFKMAGAKNLIMSLWNVPDKETQEMMQLFYQYYLQEQLPVREAFRKAQQAMRQQNNTPYSWAAFVLVE